MNTYKIQIQGMHCSACKSLITLSLEDEDFDQVNVDQAKHEATFRSQHSEQEVRELLDKIFAELGTYKYSELIKEV